MEGWMDRWTKLPKDGGTEGPTEGRRKGQINPGWAGSPMVPPADGLYKLNGSSRLSSFPPNK